MQPLIVDALVLRSMSQIECASFLKLGQLLLVKLDRAGLHSQYEGVIDGEPLQMRLHVAEQNRAGPFLSQI